MNIFNNILNIFTFFLKGLWNNFGIFGKISLILLSPFVFVLLLSLFIVKYALKIFFVFIDEITFHVSKFYESSTESLTLFSEILFKIRQGINYLWNKLVNDPSQHFVHTFSNNYLRNLISEIIKNFFYLVMIFLIPILTLSSFIYFYFADDVKVIKLILLRLFYLFPIAHRLIRLLIKKDSLSFENIFKINNFVINDKKTQNVYSLIGIVVILILILLSNPKIINSYLYNDFSNNDTQLVDGDKTKVEEERTNTNTVQSKQEEKRDSTNNTLTKEDIIDKKTNMIEPNIIVHTVSKGEGLYMIAKKYDINPIKLANDNSIKQVCKKYKKILICSKKSKRHKHKSNCYKGKCMYNEYEDLEIGQVLKINR